MRIAHGLALFRVARSMSAQSSTTTRSPFTGCLLASAVGDALGAPIEFLSRSEIVERFGPGGITDFASAYGGIGKITDDTRMMLFAAEALLRAYVRGCTKGICHSRLSLCTLTCAG